ncbi:hemin uptake protein HemP [Luteimonas sp. R10]|uniref:hemin uptake protein HemP n=1 Tax=Luteimonas sp. R10 TaxID=3108176 RepID=UPI00308F1CE1|nr:hemin uptake protein HemP [Luteimonas sp. R10]
MLANRPHETSSDVHPADAGPTSPTLLRDGVEVDSARLLQGQREVRIRHGGECYRLRHTRNDKLILTK